MAKWVFEYLDGETWTAFEAEIGRDDETLNGHEEVTLSLVNVGAAGTANRALVAVDQTVRLSFDGNVVFTGRMVPIKYTTSRIYCVLYNDVYETMKPKTYTHDYTAGEQADTILGAVCAAAGVTAGSCPTTEIAVRFDEADCYNAALFIADCLNLDHWTTLGTTFNVGTRGSLKAPSNVQIRSRDCDRAKIRDKVRVKGVDAGGLEIVGEAGTGTNVQVFREKKAATVATLNSLAAKYLAELNTDAKGLPIEIPIADGYGVAPGDTVAVSNAQYAIDATVRVCRVIRTASRVVCHLEKRKATLQEMILDVKKYNDLGIYPNQPTQITPWALNLQALIAHYHLTEGEGTTARDTNPNTEEVADGTITNGDWVQGPQTKVLNFDADGYVDCGTQFTVGGLSAVSVGIWLSAEDHFADSNYAFCKNGQIAIQHYGTDDRIRFGIYIGGAWQWVTSDANISPLWGRTFAAGVYDGTNLLLYINGRLHKSQARTGGTAAIDASASNLIIGGQTTAAGLFHGVLYEAMGWSRALSAQEVSELYFFPLVRVF